MGLTIKFKESKIDSKDVCKIILLNKNNKILFLKRSEHLDNHPGEWDLPGGHSQVGEDFLSACKRECEEETSIIPKRVKKLFSDGHHHIFLGDYKDNRPSLSKEHTTFKTIDPKVAIGDGFLTPKYQKYVKKAMEIINDSEK